MSESDKRLWRAASRVWRDYLHTLSAIDWLRGQLASPRLPAGERQHLEGRITLAQDILAGRDEALTELEMAMEERRRQGGG